MSEYLVETSFLDYTNTMFDDFLKDIPCNLTPKELAVQLIKDGTLVYNKLQFIRTDYRIEFLTKKKLPKIIKNFFKTIKNKKFIIIYSHESEFNKKKTQNTLNRIMKILTIKFKLENIHP